MDADSIRRIITSLNLLFLGFVGIIGGGSSGKNCGGIGRSSGINSVVVGWLIESIFSNLSRSGYSLSRSARPGAGGIVPWISSQLFSISDLERFLIDLGKILEIGQQIKL